MVKWLFRFRLSGEIESHCFYTDSSPIVGKL